MMWQKTLEDLLSKSIGLDPASLGPTLLLRAIHRRMRALEVAREEEYVTRVQRSIEELQELIEELVVSESWFFRDNQPFILLRRHAADWLTAPTSPTFRALSLACATGDEPYSIAMTLLDVGLPRDRFEVDAIDISLRALEKARRGVYGSKALRVVEPGMKARFFRNHPDGMEVLPDVRLAVRFSSGNLVKPETLRTRPPYQVIFCRNLLIYLTDAARKTAVETLDRLLGPTGLLFVGHAELLHVLESKFTVVRLKGSFAYQRRTSNNDPGGIAPIVPATPERFPTYERSSGAERFTATGPSASENRFATGSPSFPATFPARTPPTTTKPPTSDPFGAVPRTSPPLSSAGASFNPGGGDLIDQATELANKREYDRAAELCEQSIQMNGPSARAYYLMGMIHHARNDQVRAEWNLGRAVFLDREHEDALLALSLIARLRGDNVAATNYQRRAERARMRKTSNSGGERP